MLNRFKSILIATVFCFVAFNFGGFAACDEIDVPANERLKNDQEAISGRFARFERLLSQMADMLGHEDPERAELLRRAISKGREQAIGNELDVIARKLGEADYGAAREKQITVEASIENLLKILQSEDRRSSAEKERERLNDILKNVRNAVAEQRAARGAAQNSRAPSNAAPAQQKALKRTDGILEGIDDHDKQQSAAEGGESQSESGSKSGDEGKSPKYSSGDSSEGEKNGKADERESAESKRGDKFPKDEDSKHSSGKPGDPAQQSPDEKSDGEKPSDRGKGSPGQPSKSQESKSQKAGQSQSKPGDESEQQDEEEQTPGRQNLEAAQQLMQEALEQLKDQDRDDALDHQDAAIAQLQKAARELEEMLKQLREEEKEMILATLEARLQRLLAQQIEINEGTVDLAATPRKDWLDNAVSQCRDLSQRQVDVTRECSQTTGLLREDGTSVSILVAMEDVETDMNSVAERLRKTRVNSLTQSIQQDIKEALEELVKATQTEMEEMKSEQRQQQQQQSQSQEKPPLVELMAEIRVLRSLQIRVNRRTKKVDELLQDAVPDDVPSLHEQIGQLSERQLRLRESAAELSKRMEKKR